MLQVSLLGPMLGWGELWHSPLLCIPLKENKLFMAPGVLEKFRIGLQICMFIDKSTLLLSDNLGSGRS